MIASLIRSPFGPIQSSRQVRDPFEQMFRNFWTNALDSWSGDQNDSCNPVNCGCLADLQEDDKSYSLRLDAPGVQTDDVEVHYDDQSGVLSVAMTRDEENSGSGQNYRFKERRFGKVSRAFDLPHADGKTVDAKLQNGVLTITAQKTRESREKVNKIKVTAG